jgi:16S rRNA U516 pseudouridylate synthase RsuA-like enzyme
VIHLQRTAYAGLTAGRLHAGEWRILTPEEIEGLKNA